MTDWIVPIGQMIGVGSESERFTVRSGGRIFEFDEFQTLAWGAMIGKFDDAPQPIGWDLANERLSEMFRRLEFMLGRPELADYYQHFQQEQLAVRLGRDEASIQQFFSEHRFHATLVGLWPSPEEPERRFIGFDDDAVLSLPSDVYDVYVESSAHPTIQDACVSVALRDSTEPEVFAERIVELRAAFIGTARVITMIGGGHFDRATAA